MRFGKAQLKNCVFRLALLSPFTTFAADLKRRKDDGISLHTLEPGPGIVSPRQFYPPMVQRAVDAANQTGGRVFATDWDQNALGERVLDSAVKCYNAAVQRQLYAFFTSNSTWSQETAGQTEKLGYTDGSVALAGSTWRFNTFTQQDYERVYEELRNSDRKVETYSDMDTLPETPSVTLEVQN